MPYEAVNASHIKAPQYKDANNNWFGIYTGMLGIMYNKDELERKGLDAPKDFADLTDEKYKGLIWSSNYNTAGTAKLIVNTMIQKYGHDDGIKFLVDLDKNIAVYTKSGSGPSKNIGTGECTIGLGFLHDGIYQIVDNGYDNIGLQVPTSGTSCEIGATAIFKGAKHENAAKLWIEYALSPECVELPPSTASTPTTPWTTTSTRPRPTPSRTSRTSWPPSAVATTASRPSRRPESLTLCAQA